MTDAERIAELERSLAAAREALRELSDAAIAYDSAIQSCANDPERMASFCTAEGDDLDFLYVKFISAAHECRQSLAPQEGER